MKLIDYETKNEIKNQVENILAGYKTDEQNKKLFESIIGELHKIDGKIYEANVVAQAIKAKHILDSEDRTTEEVEAELSKLINVCMTAPDVIIQYAPEQER